jgi:hypothetical protein
MQMRSRLKHSWSELATLLGSGDLTQQALVTALRVWIGCSLRHVSSKADALVRDSRDFDRFTTMDAMAFPISRTAVQNLLTSVQSEPPDDPERLVERVLGHVLSLTIYRLPGDGCEVCQSELELWTLPSGSPVLMCAMLGHICSLDRDPLPLDTPGLEPASRSVVLATFPNADLLTP